MSDTPRLMISAGEPAGIGPELVVRLAQLPWQAELAVCADPQLLIDAASLTGLPLELSEVDYTAPARPHRPGHLKILPRFLTTPVTWGQPDPDNAPYVLDCLRAAANRVRSGEADALVTGPVHKGVINDAGIPFSGHTEFLAELAGVEQVVMMLATDELRVALATTHLPLRAVPDAITEPHLERVIRILHQDLQRHFGLDAPRILVCGLNPHAGECGHLGREEIEVIEPLLARLRGSGIALTGPLPADTAFTPGPLQQADAVLAMYHDQGLPVLKFAGFNRAVNITLGLPFVRTSVDHGTGLDIAGRNLAKVDSFRYTIDFTIGLLERARARGNS